MQENQGEKNLSIPSNSTLSFSYFYCCTPVLERWSTREKFLNEDKISVQLLMDTLSDVTNNANSDSKNYNYSSIL